jgi:CHAT domain-containing protein/Tfp pilus assembly protein PilF
VRPGFSAGKGPRLSLPFTLLLWTQFAHSPSAQASGYRPSLPQSSTQQRSTEAQNTQDVTTLEPGKRIERELSGGQKHNYEIALTKGQYIRVDIKPQGIDVGVSLQTPGRKEIVVFAALGIVQDAIIHRVAESSGIHRVNIYARAKAPAGRYEIRLAELRPATENDLALQQARELLEEIIPLHREGRYSEARPLLIRALEIRERAAGPDSRGVAEVLGALATNHQATGDYANAEPLLERSLKIVEKVHGPEHHDVAHELRRLGLFYYRKGDYLKAEERLQKALAIFEKTDQTENINVPSLLGSLGDIYYELGAYETAEKYYQRSHAIWEKSLGPDHYHLADSFARLGRTAYAAGDYTKAEAMFSRELDLSARTFGKDHIQVVASLIDLAMLYSTTGDDAKADALYQRALAIREQKAAMDSPDAQELLFGMARLYAGQGRASEALKFQTQASEIEERQVELNLVVGSEHERQTFLAKLTAHSSRNIWLHTSLAPHDAAARDLAVTTILRRKGRVQDAMADSLAALRRRSGSEDRELFDRLNTTTSQLARLILNGPQNMTLVEHQNKVKALEEQRGGLEGEISRRSAGFYERAQPVSLAAVQAAVPDQAALIEFAIYHPFDPKAPDNHKAYGEPRYVAYVVRRQGEVQWKELGAAKEVDDAVGALRRALRDPRRRDVRELARALDEKVMRPIRTLTGDATQLLISSDGALNLIPFEVLIDEQERYLVERYSFTYLTSGRELLRMQVAREARSKPTVVADPSFGEPVTEQMASLAARSAVAGGRSRRRSVTDARSLSETYFAPLNGTAQEARTIQTLFPEANVLTGARATESALKQLAAPRLLHVATHGFFLSEPGAVATGSAAQVTTRGINPNARIENPLLRSGLALAGANLRGSGSNGDDGILTALEASGLNLWGTKLVVLSACDTGLGEVHNGEGVYGLRRAFGLAGAESLVMSLWPVSDYATRRLMSDYYRHLQQGMGRGASLRQVQLDMLRRNPQLHPFYWANFIQSGEWANLDGKR